MFATSLLPLLSVAGLLSGITSGVPTKRQEIVPVHGSIVIPSENTGIMPGAVFNFTFDSVNYCESGYEPITVWLFEQEPSNDNLTTEGDFVDGSYLNKFGEWLIPNFGLPAEYPPGPPPANLTMPDLSTVAFGSLNLSNATLYLVVVETFMDCPGDVADEYGITSSPILYNPA